MDVFTLAGLSALVLKATSLVKYLAAKDWNGTVTQLVTWAAGIGAAFLAGAADLAAAIVVNGVPITDMDGPSKALLGLALASVGSFAYDIKKSLDGGDSAAEPALIGD